MRKVSESTVGRLSLYLRLLSELATEGRDTLSSDELARRCQTSAAQVRKDLSSFGTFGKRGRGYVVAELVVELRRILGLERRWRVALVGAGKIGAALLAYRDFALQGFDIEAVFDSDPAKVGMPWNGVIVQSSAELDGGGLRGIEIVIRRGAGGRGAGGGGPHRCVGHPCHPQLRPGPPQGPGRRGGQDGEHGAGTGRSLVCAGEQSLVGARVRSACRGGELGEDDGRQGDVSRRRSGRSRR
jgi:hypothetical protein